MDLLWPLLCCIWIAHERRKKKRNRNCSAERVKTVRGYYIIVYGGFFLPRFLYWNDLWHIEKLNGKICHKVMKNDLLNSHIPSMLYTVNDKMFYLGYRKLWMKRHFHHFDLTSHFILFYHLKLQLPLVMKMSLSTYCLFIKLNSKKKK